jgi:hypothetical protein
MINKIRNSRCVVFAVIVHLSAFSACQPIVSRDDDPGPNAPPGKIGDDGLSLPGGFRFLTSGDGDTSQIVDSRNNVLVPASPVLVLVKKSYCIGYVEGEFIVVGGPNQGPARKIFFVLTAGGGVTFHLPSKHDPRFCGDVISNPFLGSSGISVGKTQGFAGVEAEHLSFAKAQ